MSEYTRSIASALKQIKKKGGILTITRKTGGTYNVATSTRSGETTENQSLFAINTPGGPRGYSNTVKDGAGMIRDVFKHFAVAASGATFVPLPGDTVSWLGLTSKIIGSTPISINGEDVIYKIGTD